MVDDSLSATRGDRVALRLSSTTTETAGNFCLAIVRSFGANSMEAVPGDRPTLTSPVSMALAPLTRAMALASSCSMRWAKR